MFRAFMFHLKELIAAVKYTSKKQRLRWDYADAQADLGFGYTNMCLIHFLFSIDHVLICRNVSSWKQKRIWHKIPTVTVGKWLKRYKTIMKITYETSTNRKYRVLAIKFQQMVPTSTESMDFSLQGQIFTPINWAGHGKQAICEKRMSSQ